MGASLRWRPCGEGWRYLATWAPESMMDALYRAFGSRTPRLHRDEAVPVLQGLAAGERDERTRESYESLIQALMDFEEVQVDAEY